MTELNHQIKAELKIGDAATDWGDLGCAFKNISQSLNEVVYQASYLADEGWGSSEVTGGQLTVTFTGDYIKNDPVIEYIFSPDVQHNWGDARKTELRITKGDKVINWSVTLAKITEAGGDANQPNAVTLEIHGNGKPTVA